MRELHFSQVCLFPSIGAAQRLATADSAIAKQMNTLVVESIFRYRDEFCVNGEFFVPVTCGALLCYKF